MSSYLDLEDVKKHLNVYHDEDDAYIESLMEVAEDALSLALKRPLYDLEDRAGRLPASLYHALRILVAKYYAQREGTAYSNMDEMPFGMQSLIKPYVLER